MADYEIVEKTLFGIADRLSRSMRRKGLKGRTITLKLRWEGFEVVSVGPADGAYPRTQIVDFTTSPKGSAIYRLMRLYERYGDDVVSQPTEGSAVDFRVVLGSDYDPCFSTKVYWNPDPLPTPTPLPTVVPTPTPLPTPTPR